MYTFSPLAAVNTIDNHAGFFVIAAITLFAFVIVWANNDEELNMYKVFVLFSIPVFVAAAVSWNTGTYAEYRNERVIGTFAGYIAEGYNVDERSGKTTRRVDKHFTYVVYEVNGSRILFPASTGTEYPKTAVLYKN